MTVGQAQRPGHGRRISRISRGELERRWGLVRGHLRARGLDALVAVGVDFDLSGTTRWLTDTPVSYRKIVAVYPDDWMTIVDHGPAGRSRVADGDDPDYPGAGEIITVSEFSSVHFTQRYGVAALVGALRRRGVRAVGVANPKSMPHDVLEGLRDGLPDAAMHDATAFIDQAKAIKSAEEIALMCDAASLQDAVFAATVDFVRPGLSDYEVSAFATYEARRRGGNHGIALCGSGQPGDPAFMRSSEQGGRIMQEGDLVTLLIENGSPDGYFLELGRTLSLGPAPSAMHPLVDVAKAAQANTLSLIKPGARPADIFAAHNRFMIEHGLQLEARLYAHGQGLDLIERPLIRDDEDMTIEAGMVLSVHPAGVANGCFAFVCDNFLVEDGGVRRLHATEQKVFEIDRTR